MRNLTKILVVLISICFIGGCIYFVGGVSATIPPIKKYIYKGSIIQFGNLLNTFIVSHSNVEYKITARDSGNLNVNFRDIAIDVKKGTDSLSFGLVCEENSTNGVWETELDLVEAMNKTKLTGGYGSKADGLKPLLDYFESDLLLELKKKQHADIHLKKEGFFERIHIY